MTSRILLFDPVERFVAGTVGQPGERTFFIQARQGSRLISVSLEKSQVQALADRLTYMVREIKQSDPTIAIPRLTRDDAPLQTPIEEEFRVGVIGLAFDDARQLIQVDLQAVSDDDQDEPDFIDILRVMISPSVATQFSQRALSVVSAGRQPCPFCGGPIDLRGHLCPRANGYRR
jgi:uncharacterized repeat protein (TIGR03847 family)